MSERILGITHKDTVFRYMYAGASYADTNQVHILPPKKQVQLEYFLTLSNVVYVILQLSIEYVRPIVQAMRHFVELCLETEV